MCGKFPALSPRWRSIVDVLRTCGVVVSTDSIPVSVECASPRSRKISRSHSRGNDLTYGMLTRAGTASPKTVAIRSLTAWTPSLIVPDGGRS